MDDDELTYHGPGDEPAEGFVVPEPVTGRPDTDGTPPDVAAYGAGPFGALLLAIAGWVKRRRRERAGAVDGRDTGS